MLFHSLSNRRAQRSLDAPAIAEALVEGVSMDAQLLCPLRNGQGLPGELNESVRARVIGLLLSSSPSAIFFGIAQIVIDSVERHPFRSIPHIRNKLLKALLPWFTNSNTSPAVVLKKLVARVVASVLNILPNRIKGGFAFPVGRVGLVKILSPRATALAMQAAARLRHAAFEMVAPNNFLRAAIANAGAVPASRLHNKSSKALSYKNRVSFLTGHKISFGCRTHIEPITGDVNYGF